MEELDAILDGTAAALTAFDLDSLLELLRRAEALRDAGCAVTGRPIIARHQLLETLLRSTESNLAMLSRLQNREGTHSWER